MTRAKLECAWGDQTGEEVSWSVAPPFFFKYSKISPSLLILGRDNAQLTVDQAPNMCAVQ